VSETLLGDDGVAALINSPLADQLESLELKKNGLTPAGAAQLTKGTFPKLTYLSISGNPLGENGLTSLKAAFPTVHLVARGASVED
jgi:hypothetical protein